MKKILFATGNISKAQRFSKGLEKNNIKLITLKDIDKELNIEENGENAIENALIKARAYSKIVDIPVMAMDDNLFIDNIPKTKQPGMYVRRVNGKRLSDEEMIEYYSNLAKEYGENGKLTGRWIYGMAVINKGKEYTYTWSKEDFYIIDKPSKIINPGYPLNSISFSKKLNKYFTDITEEDKLKIKEDEKEVIEFITKSINNQKSNINTETIYNKLVRDNIPDIIKNNGETAITKVLNNEEYRKELYKKLLEESEEVINAKSKNETLEELADVFEVIKTIAELEESSIDIIADISDKKRIKKGSFTQRLFLIKTKK